MRTALAFLLATAVQDGAWSEHVSKDGGYSVRLPGKPEEEKQPLEVPPLKLVTIVWTAAEGEMVYLTSHTAYPPNPDRNEARILDSALNGILKSVQAKTHARKASVLAGTTGVAATFETGETAMIGEIRIYFSRNKLYQVGAIGPKAGYAVDGAKKCLDSFKLLDAAK